MAQSLADKVAIVTGGSNGIGLATVKLFLANGAKVVSIDIRDPSEPLGNDFLSLKVDVSNEEQVKSAIDQTVTKFGRIDVLVNNAGVADDSQPLLDQSVELWNRVFAINTHGPMYLMRHAMPHMLKNPSSSSSSEKGNIVNVCSVAARGGGIAGAAYTAAKHALLGLTRNTAWSYRDQGIRCNAILPGGVATNVIHNSAETTGSKAFNANNPNIAWFQSAPGFMEYGLCTPEELAQGILFLATSTATNGAELKLDKAWTAC